MKKEQEGSKVSRSRIRRIRWNEQIYVERKLGRLQRLGWKIMNSMEQAYIRIYKRDDTKVIFEAVRNP